jgi:DNA circularisation protein N-terminus
MSKITDLAYVDRQGQTKIKSPWRADLQPAHFRQAFFHVEGSVIGGGRRLVTHEFPKKSLPYTEDMGRKAFEFTVRGYCIQFPQDAGGETQLYMRDYRIARDILADELTSGQPGPLYLPTFGGREIIVICPTYRLTEEDKAGGYCTFDMTFVELGAPPRQPSPDNRDEVVKYFKDMRDRNVDILTRGTGVAAPAPNGGSNV